ncbi:MAG: Phage integrase [Firmicutes bacterium]|nr:Phage integrase [Bacillota bacterium]
MAKILFDESKDLYYTKLTYQNATGVSRRKSLYAKSEKELKTKIKEFQRNQEAGLVLEADKMTLKEWLTTWLTVYKKQSLEVTSYAAYQHQSDAHIIPELGGLKLKQLNRLILQDFFNRKAAELSPSTLDLIKAILVNALKEAVADGYLIKTPAIGLKLPQVKDKDVKPLTKDEIKAVLAAAKGHRIYSLIYLDIHTGLRKGELTGLTWENVDMDKGVVNVRQGAKYDREQKKYIIGSPKSESGIRTIPIPKAALEELKKHKSRQAAEILELGSAYEKNNLVFPGFGGKIYTHSVITHQFNRIIKDAGVERRTFHDLRHTFASIGISQKVNIKALSVYLGHSDISITLDTYGHLMPGDSESIAETIGNYLTGM